MSDTKMFSGGVDIDKLKVQDTYLIDENTSREMRKPIPERIIGYEFDPIKLSRETAYLRKLVKERDSVVLKTTTPVPQAIDTSKLIMDLQSIAGNTYNRMVSMETPSPIPFVKPPLLADDVDASIRAIFTAQTGIEAARHENNLNRDQAKLAVERKERVRDATLHLKANIQRDMWLSKIDTTLNDQFRFSTTNTVKWQNAILEASYRHTYLLTELHTLQEAALKISHSQNETLIYNTSLPDSRKSTKKERWDIYTEQTIHDLYATLLYSGIKRKLAAVNEVAGNAVNRLLTGGISSGVSVLKEKMGLPKGASLIGDVLNKGVSIFSGLGKTAADEETDKPDKVMSFLNDPNSLWGKGKKLVGDLQGEYDDALTRELDKPFYNTVRYGIPGYLARIYRELVLIRTPTALKRNLVEYNPMTNTFTGEPSQLVSSLGSIGKLTLNRTKSQQRSQMAPEEDSGVKTALGKVRYTTHLNQNITDIEDINPAAGGLGTASPVDLIILKEALKNRKLSPELRAIIKKAIIAAGRHRVLTDTYLDDITSMRRGSHTDPYHDKLMQIFDAILSEEGGAGGSRMEARLAEAKAKEDNERSERMEQYAIDSTKYAKHTRNILLKVNDKGLSAMDLAFLESASPMKVLAMRGLMGGMGLLKARREGTDKPFDIKEFFKTITTKKSLYDLGQPTIGGEAGAAPPTVPPTSPPATPPTGAPPSPSPVPPNGEGSIGSYTDTLRDLVNSFRAAIPPTGSGQGSGMPPIPNPLGRGFPPLPTLPPMPMGDNPTVARFLAIMEAKRKLDEQLRDALVPDFAIHGIRRLGLPMSDYGRTPPVRTTTPPTVDEFAGQPTISPASTPPNLPSAPDTPLTPEEEASVDATIRRRVNMGNGSLLRSKVYRQAIRQSGVDRLSIRLKRATPFEEASIRRSTEQVALNVRIHDLLDTKLTKLIKQGGAGGGGESGGLMSGLGSLLSPKMLMGLATGAMTLGVGALGVDTFKKVKEAYEYKVVDGSVEANTGVARDAEPSFWDSIWKKVDGEDGGTPAGQVVYPETYNGTLASGAGQAYFNTTDSSVITGYDSVIADLNKLNPTFLGHLLGMAKEFFEKTGNKLFLTESFRTFQQQQNLYATTPKGMAAKPGSSTHEFGLAVDMDTKKGYVAKLESMGLLRKYGFWRPIKGEPHHIEPIGIHPYLDKIRAKAIDTRTLAEAISWGKGRGGGGAGAANGKLSSRTESEFKRVTANVDPVAYADNAEAKPDMKGGLPPVGAPGNIGSSGSAGMGGILPTTGLPMSSQMNADSPQGRVSVPTGSLAGQKGDAAKFIREFEKYGWTRPAAIAVAGNIEQESGFDPHRVGDKTNPQGSAYGLAQWRLDRRGSQFTKIIGKPIEQSTFEDQVKYLDWELRNGAKRERKAGMALANPNVTIAQGVDAFVRDFERPKNTEWEVPHRTKLANELAKKLGGTVMTGTPSMEGAAGNSGPAGEVGVPGSTKKGVDGAYYDYTPPAAKVAMVSPSTPITPVPAKKGMSSIPPPPPPPQVSQQVFDRAEVKLVLEQSLTVQRDILQELKVINSKLSQAPKVEKPVSPPPIPKPTPPPKPPAAKPVVRDTSRIDAVNVSL